MRPTVLIVAGVDSSGGAGLLKDARTLADLGVDALCVVTAVTAQTTSDVLAIHHVPPAAIRAQIAASLATGRVSAVKIGMLGVAATVEVIAESLPAQLPTVLDPVLNASSGGVLLDVPGRNAMRARLFPRTTLLTPNLPEAATLLGREPAVGEAAVLDQARQLVSLGAGAVFIKGGHGTGNEAIDYLVPRSGSVLRMALPRLRLAQRGTGCALSSAIAAGLALGLALPQACRQAKEYVHRLISGGDASVAGW